MKKENKAHMWTKEEIKKFIKLWDSCTKDELAEELGISRAQVGSMAGRIRKTGFFLSKKSNRGIVGALILEAIKELKGKK